VIAVPAVLGGIDGVSSALRSGATAAAALVAIAGVFVVPQLRWRRWRWELRDEEVDLRHGAVTEIRTIVPMARVQHVDVRRSFLAQSFGMADVVIHTAAGETKIPMLTEADAVEVRDRIADLARSPDDL
jgi:membrane protein YdbS with pleckstrin-like domain